MCCGSGPAAEYLIKGSERCVVEAALAQEPQSLASWPGSDVTWYLARLPWIPGAIVFLLIQWELEWRSCKWFDLWFHKWNVKQVNFWGEAWGVVWFDRPQKITLKSLQKNRECLPNLVIGYLMMRAQGTYYECKWGSTMTALRLCYSFVWSQPDL